MQTPRRILIALLLAAALLPAGCGLGLTADWLAEGLKEENPPAENNNPWVHIDRNIASAPGKINIIFQA